MHTGHLGILLECSGSAVAPKTLHLSQAPSDAYVGAAHPRRPYSAQGLHLPVRCGQQPLQASSSLGQLCPRATFRVRLSLPALLILGLSHFVSRNQIRQDFAG